MEQMAGLLDGSLSMENLMAGFPTDAVLDGMGMASAASASDLGGELLSADAGSAVGSSSSGARGGGSAGGEGGAGAGAGAGGSRGGGGVPPLRAG